MKNLSKVLSLVLALAMIVGVFTIGAAAFTDDEDIDYEEAVSVLSAIKVLEGYTDGSFAPEGTVTRAEAAAIICRLVLGRDLADALITEKAPFEDVKATNWAAGYIAYCVQEGIISGYGDGNFGPADKVTGYQLAKMLLVALGFDAEENGLTGANWQLNTAKLAVQNGIFEGNLGANYTEAATREEASLYAFNALNYTASGKTSVYEVVAKDEKTVLYSGSDALTALIMQQANSGSKLSLKTTSVGSIGDVLYTLKRDETKDDFGRSTITWTGKNNVKVVLGVEPTLTYTTAVSPSEIYNALGLKADTEATWYIDGWTDAVGSGTKLTIAKADTTKSVGGNGVVTEVYYDGTAIKVVQVATYLGKITGVTEAKAATATTPAVAASVNVEVYGTDYGTVEYSFETTGFAKNDYVLVTAVNAHDGNKMTIKSMEKATVVVGQISKYVGNVSVTIGSTTYAQAEKATTVVPNDKTFTDTFAFYTDGTNVYLAGAVEEAATVVDGYLYVIGYQIAMDGAEGDLFNAAVATTAAVKAKVITTAGVEQVIDLDVYTKTAADGKVEYYYIGVDGNEQKIAKEAAYTTDGCGKWVAYTVEDGEYTLSKLVGAAEVTLKDNYSKATTLEGKYMTSTTTYTYINTVDKKVTTVSGYKNIEIAQGAQVLIVFADTTGAIAKEVYLVKTSTDVADTTATYAYAAQKGAVVSTGTEWTFYIKGEVKTLPVDGKVKVEANHVYDLTISTEGVVTKATDKATIGDGAEVKFVDETYFLTDTVYTYADGCEVYNITTGTPGTADTIEVGDYVVVVAVKDGAALLVYIVK